MAVGQFERYRRLSWLLRAQQLRWLTPEESDQVQQLRTQFGRWANKGWTNRSLSERVDDIADICSSNADALREHDRLALKQQNEVLRGSPSHLNDSITLDDRHNAHIAIGGRPGLVVEAVHETRWLLRSTRQFVADVARRAAKASTTSSRETVPY